VASSAAFDEPQADNDAIRQSEPTPAAMMDRVLFFISFPFFSLDTFRQLYTSA
jgi:hypothetical protein